MLPVCLYSLKHYSMHKQLTNKLVYSDAELKQNLQKNISTLIYFHFGKLL